MPHRSALLAAVLALALPGAAGAQQYRPPAPVPVPPDAPTVMTTPAGTVVLAFVHRGDLCLAIQPAGEPRPTRVPGGYDGDDGAPGTCASLPVLTPFGASAHGDFRSGVSRAVTIGVAGADTAAVELRHDGATVGHGAAVPSPLPGAAAEPRIFAIEHPIGAFAEELATLDAAGMVRRAFGPDTHSSRYLAEDEEDAVGERPRGPIVLQGRRGTTSWHLRRSTQRVLASTPLEPERHVTQACLSLDWRAHGTTGEGNGICDDEASTEPLLVTADPSCRGPGSSVIVLARPGVRRVAVVLGDGRRVALPLRALPGTPATPRAGAVVLGDAVAVRRVLAFDARGRVLGSTSLQLPPGSAAGERCEDFGAGFFGLFTDDGPAPDDTPLRSAAPHGPRVVDAGVRICVAVDRAPRVPADCAMPPVLPSEALVASHPTATGRYVLALVPSEVASARLRLRGGVTREVTAVPVPGYTGRYAAQLRAIAADVPGRRAVLALDLRDARGRVLQKVFGPESSTPTRTDRLRPARSGLPALWSARFTDDDDRITCLAFGPIAGFGDCRAMHIAAPYGLSGTFTVDVRCAPRRTVVLAVLGRPADRLAVVTAAGRRVSARRMAIPGGNGLTAAEVVLGPHERLRRVALRTGHADLFPPAAAQQCGFAMIGRPAPPR